MVILVVAAHPDDEILGCGATVAKLVSEGKKVRTVILGEGATSRLSGTISVEELRTHAREANQVLGVTDIVFRDFPDNSFDTVPFLRIVRAVEEEIARVRPEVILTHFGNDLNIDHRITFNAVLTACRPQPDVIRPEIFSFFIPSSTDFGDHSTVPAFTPNVFIDVRETIGTKLDALKKYRSEMRDFPHSRSIKSVEIVSLYWGNRVGMESAEPFLHVRGWKLC